MPPIIPVGGLNGIKPIDAMGTGLPKMRGPQGPSNLGDAGFGSFPQGQFPQFPQTSFPAFKMPDMQPDPDEQAIAQMPPQARPTSQNTKSVGGWVKNLYEDIASMAAGVVAIPKVAATEGYQVAKHWKYLDDIFLNHPEMLTRELDRMGAQVIKSFADTYENGLGEALYKHPFSVLLDATGVLDFLGAGIKTAGKAALKAGAKAETAAKIAQLGNSIQTFPGRMVKAPFIASGQLLEKISFTQKIMQSYALSKIGREEARALGKFLAGERGDLELVAKEIFKRKIKKKDWALFDDLLDGMVPRSQITDPAMLERYDEWTKMVRGDEVKWRDLGVLTDDEMQKAALKQTALKLKDKGIFKGELYKYEVDAATGEAKIAGFTDEAYDAARKWGAGDNPFKEVMRPVYKPFVHERSFNLDDLLNALGAGEKSDAFRKWWGRMEQKTGMKPHVLDPDIWQARSMLQKAEIMGTVKYYDDAIRRHGKPIKIGGKADDGWVVVPPMLQRYIKNGLPHAMDVLVQKATEAVRHAEIVKGDRAQALKQGIKEAHAELLAKQDELLRDLEDAMKNPAEYAVQVPKEVAYMMQKSMFGPRGFWKFYDNVLNTWRDAILTFMPRYYVNNLLGNAVMLMFAGHTPFNKVAALKASDLPGEAISSMLGMEAGGASSYIAKAGEAFDSATGLGIHKGIRRFTNTMADAADMRARQLAYGTLSKEVIAREAALGNVHAQALQAAETAEEAARIISQARKDVMGAGLDELMATKRAIKAAGGNFDVLRQGIVGKKSYTMSNRNVSIAQQSQVDSITKEMADIQRSIKREKALANASPGAATSKIKELEAQLQLKVSQLEAIDPSLSIAQKMGREIEYMPDVAKIAEIQARRQALAPYAELAEKAVLQMEKFFGNYGRLHPLEREWIRRALPFWTFSKTMFQLVFNLPFLRPKTMFLWNQFTRMMMDAIGDDRLPSRLRNHIVIGGTEKGEPIMMRLGGFNPFEGPAKRSSVGGVGIPQFIDPRNNPLVKIAVESIGGYDLFTERPFTGKTDYVHLDGSVKRYDPDLDRIETVIPQKPIIASLFQQFPQMKVLRELMEASGYGGEAIGMKSARNPDGSLTYDRQFFHAILGAIGMPVSVQNPEKIKLQHALLKRGMIKRFRSASGRVDPTTRMQLESILRDMEKAEVYE